MNEIQRIFVIIALFFILLFAANTSVYIPHLDKEKAFLEYQYEADELVGQGSVQSSADSLSTAQMHRIEKLEGKLKTVKAFSFIMLICTVISIIAGFVFFDKRNKDEIDEDEWEEDD